MKDEFGEHEPYRLALVVSRPEFHLSKRTKWLLLVAVLYAIALYLYW